MEGTHGILASHATTKRRGKGSGTIPKATTTKKPRRPNNPPQSYKRDASSTSRRSVPEGVSTTTGQESKSRGVSQSLATPKSALKTMKESPARPPSSSSIEFEKKRPSTWEMIRNALLASRARKGVSRPALTKFIREKYSISIDSRFNATLRRILRNNLEKGELTQVAKSYKLTSRVAQTPTKSAPSQSTPKRGAQRKTSSPTTQQRRIDAGFGATDIHELSKSRPKQEIAGRSRTRSVPSAESSFAAKKRPLRDSDVSPMSPSLLKRHKKSSATSTGGVVLSPKKLSSTLKVEAKADAPSASAKKPPSVSYGQPKSSRKQQPARALTPSRRFASHEVTSSAGLSVPPPKTRMKPTRFPTTPKIAASRTATARDTTPIHKLKPAQPISPAVSSGGPLSKNKGGRPVSSKTPNSITNRPRKFSK